MPNIKIDYQLTQGTLKGEPVRGNAWEITIIGAEEFKLYSSTLTLPNYTVSPIEIYHFNEKARIAGSLDLSNITLEVVDTLEPKTFRILWDWWKKVYDPETGRMGFKSDYARDGYAEQFDSKGKRIRKWNFKNIWPTGVNGGQLDYSSSDPIKVSIDFAIDRATLEFS